MKKVHRIYFRFSEKEKQFLEDAYQKGAKTAQDARLLAKTLGYGEMRVRSWIYGRKRIDQKYSNKPPVFFTMTQKRQMEASYKKNLWVERKEAEKLAKKLNIEDRNRIYTWFCQRRRADNIARRVLRFKDEEKARLEAIQAENRYPNKQEVDEIAKELNVPAKRVQHFFEGRRCTRGNHQQIDGRVFDNRSHSKEQTLALEEAYQKSKYLKSEEINALKTITGLKCTQIDRWFRYKRSKDKKPEGHDPSRGRFKPEEVLVLEKAYKKNKDIQKKEAYALADSMGVVKQIRVHNWFKAKRNFDKSYSADQTKILEAEYKRNHRPSREKQKKIAKDIGVMEARVKRWFNLARQRYNHSHYVALLTPQQEDALLDAYKKNTHPTRETVIELANRLGFKERRTRTWFQNQRKKMERSNAANPQQVKPEEDIDADMQDLKVEINVKIEPMDIDVTHQKKLLK